MLALAAAGIAALALASAAEAATVGLLGGNFDPSIPITWQYKAATGEVNDLSVNLVNDGRTNAISFTESGSVRISTGPFPSGPGPRCVSLSSQSVSCQPGSLGIDVELGDQGDRVRLSGPLGPNCTPSTAICDEIWQVFGGPGNDVIDASHGTGAFGRGLSLFGDDGSDIINSNNGIADAVFCGANGDKAFVDLKDGPTGFRDCEAVSQAAIDQHPTVEIRGRSLSLRHGSNGRRSTGVELRCPRALHSGCRGALAISTLGGSSGGSEVIGHTRYHRIAAASSALVRLRIQGALAHAARRNGHIRVRVEATEQDAHGMPKNTLRTMRLLPG